MSFTLFIEKTVHPTLKALIGGRTVQKKGLIRLTLVKLVILSWGRSFSVILVRAFGAKGFAEAIKREYRGVTECAFSAVVATIRRYRRPLLACACTRDANRIRRIAL